MYSLCNKSTTRPLVTSSRILFNKGTHVSAQQEHQVSHLFTLQQKGLIFFFYSGTNRKHKFNKLDFLTRNELYLWCLTFEPHLIKTNLIGVCEPHYSFLMQGLFVPVAWVGSGDSCEGLTSVHNKYTGYTLKHLLLRHMYNVSLPNLCAILLLDVSQSGPVYDWLLNDCHTVLCGAFYSCLCRC